MKARQSELNSEKKKLANEQRSRNLALARRVVSREVLQLKVDNKNAAPNADCEKDVSWKHHVNSDADDTDEDLVLPKVNYSYHFNVKQIIS